MAISRSNLSGALVALLSFAAYSTHDVFVKILGAHYTPVQILFFSGLFSFPLVALMLIGDRNDGNLRPRHPWWSALRMVSTMVTGIGAFYAFSRLPLAQTYAILFATPLLITLLAIPILGERVGIRRGLAIVVGLIGVLIVLRPSGTPLNLGHAAALAAAVCSSLTSVVVRKIGKDERSVVLLLYPMMANFVVLGIALPFYYKPMPIEHLGMVGVIAALAVVGSLLIISAYRAAQAVIVAPMQYSQMIWATVFGFWLFEETPDLWTMLGAGVIMASGLYIVMRESSGEASLNNPVLQNKSRPETGTMPRISLLLNRGRRG